MDDVDSSAAADLSVLDELISDVQAEEAGPESPEYFDADDVGAGDSELNADDVLRQLDTVTHLSDDEANEVDEAEETSAESSAVAANTSDASDKVIQPTLDVSAELIDVNEKDFHQDAENADTSTAPREDEEPSSWDGSTSAKPNNCESESENKYADQDLHVEETDDLKPVHMAFPTPALEDTSQTARSPTDLNEVQQHDINFDRSEELLPFENTSNGDSPAAPPPAPVRPAAVITGSMNPQEDENDDSDSDEDETEEGTQPNEDAASHRQILHSSDDDDEDELEVDPAVVSTIPVGSAKLGPRNDENGKLNGYLGSKTDQISAQFEAEIRVAAVTTEATFPIGSKANRDDPAMSKIKQQQKDTPQSEDMFGIAYHSAKRRLTGDSVTSSEMADYTLPTGPSFPDEKEFEREVQIESGASFSTKEINEDDEFVFNEFRNAEDADSSATAFSQEELEARRARMEAQKAQQEAELLQELKRTTDDERKMIVIGETQQKSSSTSDTNDAMDTSLSLGELHSMYKKGLGDQSVHFLDEDTAAADQLSPGTSHPKTQTPVHPPQERLSVMGKILSKSRGLTDVIVEGDNEDAGDEQDDDESKDHDDTISAADGGRLGVQADQQTLLNYNDDDYDDEDGDGGEWKEIQLADMVARGGATEGQEDSTASTVSPMKPQQWRITYTECAGYFAEAPEFLNQRDRIVPVEFPQRSSCFSCLSRPRLTFPGAIEERDRVFCVAATPFDQSNDIFCRMLQTVYTRLVPSTTSAPSLIGGHWDNIGFQGSDPSTDLRGVGVLALLQMLYLVENHGELARRLHSLSQHTARHFPFACALINMTLKCLMALRSGALYPECNKHSSIVAGMNMLFVALCAELTTELPSSSEDVHLVLKHVLDRGYEEPLAAIDRVFDGNTLRGGFSNGSDVSRGFSGSGVQQTTPSPASPRARPSASTNVEFTEIALHSVADD